MPDRSGLSAPRQGRGLKPDRHTNHPELAWEPGEDLGAAEEHARHAKGLGAVDARVTRAPTTLRGRPHVT